jgi:short subunit dehydrogenase-like uncharacterized protein
VVAGRNEAALAALARREQLEHRCASVGDYLALANLLKDGAVVINAAGPYEHTALPLARACIDAGCHYLDLSGEYAVIEQIAELDARAKQAKVMLLPAAGFDVVASDCLIAKLCQGARRPRKLSIAITGLDAISRGSAKSVLSLYRDHVVVRREGRLRRVAPGALTQSFDFGQGPTPVTAVSWADVVTAFHTTGIFDITVYYEATAVVRLGLGFSRVGAQLVDTPLGRLLHGTASRLLPAGPGRAARARGAACVVARLEDEAGVREARLHTPEVYGFSAVTSVAIASRVLEGAAPPGFQTPARAYGPQLALELPGARYVGGGGPAESRSISP